MPKEFIMRGKTASGTNEVINMGGQARPGYVYRLIKFDLWPSTDIFSTNQELSATITADNAYEDPSNPNFKNPGLIAVAMKTMTKGENSHVDSPIATNESSVVNDLFYITQDLIIAVIDTYAGSPADVNWQCRFVEEKISASAESVANYKQYTIYNTSS